MQVTILYAALPLGLLEPRALRKDAKLKIAKMKRNDSEGIPDYMKIMMFFDNTCKLFKSRGIETTIPMNQWIIDMYNKGTRDPYKLVSMYTNDSKLREHLDSIDPEEACVTRLNVRNNGKCRTKDITDVDKMEEVIDVDSMPDPDEMQDERKRVMEEEDVIDVDNEESMVLTPFEVMHIQRLASMRYMLERKNTSVTADDIYKMTPKDEMEYNSRNVIASTNPIYNQKLDLHFLMPVAKYFKSASDIVNFMKLSKPYSRIIAMLKYNPVGDVPMDFFPNMQTQIFYSPEQYVNNKSETSFKDVIWYPEYNSNTETYDQDKTIFKNIRYNCTNEEKELKVFSMPPNVRSLEDCCFMDAKTEHVMLNNVKTLSSFCFLRSELVDIVIPDGVRVIPNNCFEMCMNLTTVVFPNSLVEIQYQAFKNCRYLKNCRLPDSVASIGKECFVGCLYCNLNIPQGLTNIESYAFSHTGIEEAILHEGTVVIENNCFSCCSELKVVMIPQSVTTLERNAFSICHKLVFVACPSQFVERIMVMESSSPLLIMDTTMETTYYRVSRPYPHYVSEEELEDNGNLILDIRSRYRDLSDDCKAAIDGFLPTFFTADL